ncbi:MAG: DUF5684 domain-containing protein [Lachnospiraceae bacterium]|nr:DUF5684 domain-containing protein [Lachnospiraceae bacterium]
MNELMQQIYKYANTSGGSVNYITNLYSTAMAILTIVGTWMVYNKANDNGWAAIIPFYREYVMARIADKKNAFWGYLIAAIIEFFAGIAFAVSLTVVLLQLIGSGFSFGGFDEDSYGLFGVMALSLIIMGIAGLVKLIIKIIMYAGLTRNFGLNGGWVVGLIFLPGVFFLIMGVSDNIRYIAGAPTYTAAPTAPYGDPAYGNQAFSNPTTNSYGTAPTDSQPQATDPNAAADQNNDTNNPYMN